MFLSLKRHELNHDLRKFTITITVITITHIHVCLQTQDDTRSFTNAEARLLQPPVQGSALAATAPKKQPILKPRQENPERLGAIFFQAKNKLQPEYLSLTYLDNSQSLKSMVSRVLFMNTIA